MLLGKARYLDLKSPQRVIKFNTYANELRVQNGLMGLSPPLFLIDALRSWDHPLERSHACDLNDDRGLSIVSQLIGGQLTGAARFGLGHDHQVMIDQFL